MDGEIRAAFRKGVMFYEVLHEDCLHYCSSNRTEAIDKMMQLIGSNTCSMRWLIHKCLDRQLQVIEEKRSLKEFTEFLNTFVLDQDNQHLCTPADPNGNGGMGVLINTPEYRTVSDQPSWQNIPRHSPTGGSIRAQIEESTRQLREAMMPFLMGARCRAMIPPRSTNHQIQLSIEEVMEGYGKPPSASRHGTAECPNPNKAPLFLKG